MKPSSSTPIIWAVTCGRRPNRHLCNYCFIQQWSLYTFVVSVWIRQATLPTQKYSDNLHYPAHCLPHCLIPSVPSDFTGTVAGNRHYRGSSSVPRRHYRRGTTTVPELFLCSLRIEIEYAPGTRFTLVSDVTETDRKGIVSTAGCACSRMYSRFRECNGCTHLSTPGLARVS